ncbi:MAG: bifunctional hydroxymethylpyrimidine kinase/phosphomethylpyrimidine kinase, partial [Candidatus Stahlbacteria bacterium]|nr:bifunctional hydroxymethylpyrimidine kinase/phosphomethylpyrimidine kinase [Candidatus Stahlbacteria bacterium]
ENITLFKPNRKEVERAMGVKFDLQLDSQNTKSVVHKLRERLGCKHLLLTLGEQGMLLCDSDSESIIPTNAREIYDTTGAGDSVIAVVTIALATGAIAKDAAIIGNIAAGIEVSKFGTIPVTHNELLTAVKLSSPANE